MKLKNIAYLSNKSYPTVLLLFLSVYSLSAMEQDPSKFFYQTKEHFIPQIKANTQAHNLSQPTLTSSAKTQVQRVTLPEIHNFNREALVDTAVKQHDKSYEATQTLLKSNSPTEVAQLAKDLIEVDFVRCFDHIDKVLQNSSDAQGAEERFLKAIKDPTVLAQVATDTSTLNKIQYYQKQILNAKLADSLCHKTLSGPDSVANQKLLIDLWYDAQKDSDLKTRIQRRTLSLFYRKVAEIIQDKLYDFDFKSTTPQQLVKAGLEIREMSNTNPTFVSYLNRRANAKLVMILNNTESILKKQYNFDFRSLEAIQKRFKVRGSEFLFPNPNADQLETQKDLTHVLHKLTTIPFPLESQDQIVHNIAHIVINLSKENKIQEAQQAIGILDCMSDFSSGSFKAISDELKGLTDNWKTAVGVAATGVGASYLYPPAGVILSTTMLGINIITSSIEFVKGIEASYNAAIRGHSYQMGQEFTKFGLNAFFIYKTYYDFFKVAQSRGKIAQALQEVNQDLRTVFTLEHLMKEIKSSAEYLQLAGSAVRRGISAITLEETVQHISASCDNIRDAIRYLTMMFEVFPDSQNFTPRNYGRPVKLHLHHIFFGKIKSGELNGYHTTSLVNPTNSSNFRILEVQQENTMGIRRAVIQLRNCKPTEKTLWPEGWTPQRIWDTIKHTLDNLDFSQFKPTRGKNLYQEVELNKSISLSIFWDPTTSTITNIFPKNNNWNFGDLERPYRQR